MSGLIFSEEQLINGNLFEFENRLKSNMNKYNDGGELLTTYFSQDELSSTVDRGLQDIDNLIGKHSPFRFTRIMNLPLNQFTPTTPENTEESQIEDISVEGDAVIFPSTIIPKQFDFFIINHIRMSALFQVTSVQYDTMKVDGYYKIHYRLHSTSKETIDNLLTQVKKTCYTDLNAIGSNRNPIIEEGDFVLRSKIEKMVCSMIHSYRSLFYNKRHNCFLYEDMNRGITYFDNCGNEFMAKYALMNYHNSPDVIVLNNKLRGNRLTLEYHNSVYNWIDIDCPERFIQKFYYKTTESEMYPESSFCLWGDTDIHVINPLSIQEANLNNREFSIFDDDQLNAFLDKNTEPAASYFDLLMWKFINKQGQLSLTDVPLYIGDTLFSSIKYKDVYFYTPIAVYIIRKILRLN